MSRNRSAGTTGWVPVATISSTSRGATPARSSRRSRGGSRQSCGTGRVASLMAMAQRLPRQSGSAAASSAASTSAIGSGAGAVARGRERFDGVPARRRAAPDRPRGTRDRYGRRWMAMV